MKQALLNLMQRTGAFAPFRLANRSRALILTYHRFGEDEAGLKTPPAVFEAQLQYLSARYRVVPLSSIAEALIEGRGVPAGVAAITIDDGYDDAYEIAFPLLRKYNLPATLFVVTGFVDNARWVWTDKMRFLAFKTEAPLLETVIGGRKVEARLGDRASRLQAAARANSLIKRLPDESKDEVIDRIALSLGVELPAAPPPEYRPVTWEQAREMDSSGLEVASHTVSHPILTNAADEQLARELSESKARLEGMLGHQVGSFCYPNGGHDGRVRRAVERAGYRCAVTTLPGFNDRQSDPLALRRIHTESDLAHFVQSTSGFEEFKNRIRRVRERPVSDKGFVYRVSN
ncbi:MAG TPA: polysaccharide deacetylase family protein [Blastocatellia bacterium]|nr:polysaccharide deacetylase family protein [Blastocatellia bacterium]